MSTLESTSKSTWQCRSCLMQRRLARGRAHRCCFSFPFQSLQEKVHFNARLIDPAASAPAVSGSRKYFRKLLYSLSSSWMVSWSPQRILQLFLSKRFSEDSWRFLDGSFEDFVPLLQRFFNKSSYDSSGFFFFFFLKDSLSRESFKMGPSGSRNWSGGGKRTTLMTFDLCSGRHAAAWKPITECRWRRGYYSLPLLPPSLPVSFSLFFFYSFFIYFLFCLLHFRRPLYSSASL